MIYLTEYSTNEITLTLSEHSGYSFDVNYIVKLFNKQTKEDRYLLLDGNNNLSLNKFRYDTFIVELTNKTDQDVLNASIHLLNEEYSYFIVSTKEIYFENEQELKQEFNNIYLEDKYNVIATGLLKVNKNPDFIEEKTSYKSKNKIVAYKKR